MELRELWPFGRSQPPAEKALARREGQVFSVGQVVRGRENGTINFPVLDRDELPETIIELVQADRRKDAEALVKKHLEKQLTYDLYKKGEIPDDIKKLMEFVRAHENFLRNFAPVGEEGLAAFFHACQVDWNHALEYGKYIQRVMNEHTEGTEQA